MLSASSFSALSGFCGFDVWWPLVFSACSLEWGGWCVGVLLIGYLLLFVSYVMF